LEGLNGEAKQSAACRQRSAVTLKTVTRRAGVTADRCANSLRIPGDIVGHDWQVSR